MRDGEGGAGTTPAMLLKSIGLELVSRGEVPLHLKAMRLASKGEGGAVTCWKCGREVAVTAGNLVDLQIGYADDDEIKHP